MVGKPNLIWTQVVRLAMAAIMAITVMVPQTTTVATAASGDRTLYLYYTHTKETGRFTFKRNGVYDKKVLRELNYFLRDWRRNEPATMDPRLFDLIWSVYQKVGASQPIHIVSAYRSPATNEMLRAKSSGVAKDSQHTKGHAMDFFIPGISLVKLRQAGMQQQVGGVGFYPTSGSPFVHLDVGSVRAWPRMTRAQLKEIFPDGRTLHLPTDGKPLSNEGRMYAQAEWQKCHQVPCKGGSISTTQVADNGNGSGKKTLVDMFFGGDEDEGEIMAVADAGPSARSVETVAVAAPVPMPRPATLAVADAEALPFPTQGSAPLDVAELAGDPSAPIPAEKSPRLVMATRQIQPGEQTAVLAIASLEAPVPAPRLLMTPKTVPNDLVTAYAPMQPDPEAQRALDMLIERETTASLPKPVAPKPQLSLASIQTASLGGATGLKGMFDMTFNALENTTAPAPVSAAIQSHADQLAPLAGTEARDVALIAPDIEHVDETMVHPVLMSSGHFAVMFEHDEADFNPATQLGVLTPRLGFSVEQQTLSADRFTASAPLLVASRQ